MLSICIISNQPNTLIGLVESINPHSMMGLDVELCVSYQFSDANLEKVKIACEHAGINIVAQRTPEPYHDSAGRFNYARSRVHSVSLASMPYILLADSDFVFKAYAGNTKYSSGERIWDGIMLLRKEPTIGIIRLQSAFGGAHLGRSFIEFKSSSASTDRGLLLRNSETDVLIADEFLHAGVGEDVAIILTKFKQGYNAYKGFNSITHRPVCKHFGRGYDIELERGGLLGVMNAHYPRFEIDTQYGKKRLHPKEWQQIFGAQQ